MLPLDDQLKIQSEKLAAVRARILRKFNIANRKNILDLGAGAGSVSSELQRRSGGKVFAVDKDIAILKRNIKFFAESNIINAKAENLPFKNSIFDLIFSQCSIMWMNAELTVSEIWRTLKPDGVFIGIEPDYGGMIEYPHRISLKNIWISALERGGADAFIGSKLPSILKKYNFKIKIDLIPEISSASSERYDLLRTLDLTEEEKNTISEKEKIEKEIIKTNYVISHLPFFIISAEKL